MTAIETRTGDITYTAGTDAHPKRVDHNAAVARRNERIPTMKQGTAAQRPVAGSKMQLYWDTGNNVLSIDDGAWKDVSPIGGGGAGAAVNANGAGAEGTSPRAARADHTHPLVIATSALNGAMSAADKAKLDAASEAIVNSALVRRNTAGLFAVGTPTATSHPTPKSYVDALVAPLALREPVVLGASVNLDTLTSTGLFSQPLNVNATLALNYPSANAGLCNVVATGAHIYQTYQSYAVSNQLSWRAKYNSAWSAWETVTTKEATAILRGLMSAADKAKLDGATPFPTGNTLAMRSATGQIQVGTPANASDAATKAFVDGHKWSGADITSGLIPEARIANATPTLNGLMSSADKVMLNAATVSSTANTIPMRDASGNTQFGVVVLDSAQSTAGNSAARKDYVDNHTWSGNDITTGTISPNRIANATASLDGLMPKADKALIDTATSSPSANALMQRNSDGAVLATTFYELQAGTQSSLKQSLTRRDWVESQIGTRAPSSHDHGAGDIISGVLAAARLPLATASVHGALSAADKRLLDAASASATPNTLVQLDANGRARVADPAGGADIANRNYVDRVSTKSGWSAGTLNSLWRGESSYIRYRRVMNNMMVEIVATFEYSGNTPINIPSSTGNITNMNMGSIPVAYAPNEYNAGLTSAHTGRMASANISMGGQIDLCAMAGTLDFAKGNAISFYGFYAI